MLYRVDLEELMNTRHFLRCFYLGPALKLVSKRADQYKGLTT